MENKNKGNIYKFKSKSSKVKKIVTKSERLKRLLLVFFLVLLLLVGRLGWLQLIQGSELKEAMYRQLTTSKIISPKRGTIYDSTGKALAISAQVDTITINPAKFEKDTEEETAKYKETIATGLSQIFSYTQRIAF